MNDEIFELIKLEEKRQAETITLIPSENYASRAVREAMGTRLGNKYSEGYPGKRYYQGNKIIDKIETIAIERAKKLFGVPHANVQPYSGSPMNLEALLSILSPGDTILGMALDAGGHLTHGSSVSMSGKLFHAIQFGTDVEGKVDYDTVKKLAQQNRPKALLIGTTAYSRAFDWKRLREIADEVGACLIADISHIAGLIAGGAYPSPVPYADIVTTTTHKTLRGPRGAMIMATERGLVRDEKLGQKIDKTVFPGMQGGPHNNSIAGIAIALQEAAQPEFKNYDIQVIKNAQVLADGLAKGGLEIVTGGTDNHLMLVDLRPLGLSGRQVAEDLEDAGIVCNYNTVPHDLAAANNPSGIRLGTPAATTRGMKEKEMEMIAGWILEVLKDGDKNAVRKQVQELCKKHPIP